MCTCCGWVLVVFVMLLADFLELVLAVAVTIIGVLVLVALSVSVTGHAVLLQAVQFSQGAFGLRTASLDILEDRLLYLLAHAN